MTSTMNVVSSRSRAQSTGPDRTGIGLRWRVHVSRSIRLQIWPRARDASTSRGCRRGGGGPRAAAGAGTRRRDRGDLGGRMHVGAMIAVGAACLNRFSARRANGDGAGRRVPWADADPLRVAFIAAECEPWAKTGGLGDVVDALARSLPSVPGATDGLVDVFLPRYRSVPVPEGAGPATVAPRSGSARARRRGRRVDRRRRGERLPAAARRPPGRLRPRRLLRPARRRRLRRQRLAVRAALPGRARGAPGRARPAGRPHPHPRLALVPGRPLPRPLVRRRPGHRPGRRRPDDPQPRLSRLDAARAARATWAWRRATASSPTTRPASTCWGPASSGPRSSNTVSPGYARESLTPELGFGLDGDAPGEGRPLPRDPQRPRHRRLEPGDRRRPRRDRTRPATCRARRPAGPTCSSGVGFDPTDDAPVLGMIGRLDPQKGFDLLADAAPRLLAAGRPARRPGQRQPGARGRLPGARRSAGRTGSRCSSGSIGRWRAGSTPASTSS